ncbi:MAG: hypothetical protein KF819_15545 [Labilithrix sp.]|nr:hypothetical protein [Labilithrix sp.]
MWRRSSSPTSSASGSGRSSIASRRAEALLLATLALVACRDERPSPPPPAPASPSSSAPPPAPASAPPPAPAPAPAPASAPALFLTGTPKSARAIGHTSVVFKLELSTGKKAVFKPASRRGPHRYKGEIAAYRLGVALGIDNVPEAYFRTFSHAAFASAAGATTPSGELFVKEAIADKDGAVRGALIPWIDDLDFIAFEKEPWWTRWRTWLRRDEPIPEDQKDLARQASNLVVFDFLSGNWDRWSGGNVGWNKERAKLLYIDNDGAFFEVPPRDALAKNEKLLRAIDRFSRSFIAKIRELDDGALAKIFGDEREGAPLLSPKALAGVVDRRRQLLEILDAKASDAGVDALSFP